MPRWSGFVNPDLNFCEFVTRFLPQAKNNQFKGLGSEKQMGQVLVQLANFTEGREGIKIEIEKGMRLSIAKTNKLHDKGVEVLSMDI